MKIKQLGNGGAFDYNQTNSSFLINFNNTSDSKLDNYLLFDCGYNVFAELMSQDKNGDIDLSKLKYVYISHMDDDHVGSLKTLIYYMYFMLNKKVLVLCNDNIMDQLHSYLSDIDGYIEGGNKVNTPLFTYSTTNQYDYVLNDHIVLSNVVANHFKPSYGLTIVDSQTNELLVISSDSKYSEDIHTTVKNCIPSYKTVVLHDYSHWDCESKQVHCCKTDWENYKDIHYIMIPYHTGGTHFNDWYLLGEFLQLNKEYNETVK